ncbi:MAG: hypothetical protein JW807_14105 [Spirochaetes bacterium]|nr:hypothetical protein [Spirochaetota bacterium]
MAAKKSEMNRWKREQLEYFKRYLGSFHIDSKEYQIIMKGIQELEKSL